MKIWQAAAAVALIASGCVNNEPGRCIPNCSGRTCGADPRCGILCGNCPAGQYCSGGTCVCTPDCSTRECGPDPACPGSWCGGCSDGDVCSDDLCSAAGRCQYSARPDGRVGCRDWLTLDYCSGGSVDPLNCAEACFAGGYSATYGCDFGDEICSCTDYNEQCIQGETVCLTDGTHDLMAICLSGSQYGVPTDFWYLSTCQQACENAGYSSYTGDCGPNANGDDVCFCCDASCAGRECGDDGCGGSCGSCGFDEVCSNGNCVEDPCSECLSICSGLPGCCTGCGCMCQDECGGWC